MAQSVSDSMLPVLARLSIAAVFIWMGLVKLFAVASGIAVLSRGDMSSLGALEPIRVVLELGGGIVLLLGAEAKRAGVALLAALVIEYFATQNTGGTTAWLAGQNDPSVIAIQRAVVLAGAVLLAIAYDSNQSRGPQESDTSFGLVALLGRWCIGGMMALTAVRDLFDFSAGARLLGDQGVPLPEVVLALYIGLRLVAGWALIIGLWTRLAALVLLALAAIAYNPLLLVYRASLGDARDVAPAHLALGLIAALLFAFLLEGARRHARPVLRAGAPSRAGH
jgi:putative oxidoreductase